jgi:hypothetical protein
VGHRPGRDRVHRAAPGGGCGVAGVSRAGLWRGRPGPPSCRRTYAVRQMSQRHVLSSARHGSVCCRKDLARV